MDGFTGFKTAAAEELPDSAAVMDPFHVAQLADEAVDTYRQRVQQDTYGHRGRRGDSLYQARRTLIRPAGPYSPRLTCSPTNKPPDSKTCSPMMTLSRSKPPGASTNASSRPTAAPTVDSVATSWPA